MIEIIVEGKTAREKLFDTYYSHDYGAHKITPKNNEIREYCDFLEKYYALYKKANYLDVWFYMEMDDETYEKLEDYSVIENFHNFLFKFPDEETAFYFKLKYC